jgi:hypothetical protein
LIARIEDQKSYLNGVRKGISWDVRIAPALSTPNAISSKAASKLNAAAVPFTPNTTNNTKKDLKVEKKLSDHSAQTHSQEKSDSNFNTIPLTRTPSLNSPKKSNFNSCKYDSRKLKIYLKY